MQTLSFFNRLCLADICFVHNYLAFPENYPMHNTGRRHHGFLYTLQGTETYRFADKTIAAVPHSVLYIPKNEDYTITFSDKISDVRTIDFEMAAETEPARPFLVKLPAISGWRRCRRNAASPIDISSSCSVKNTVCRPRNICCRFDWSTPKSCLPIRICASRILPSCSVMAISPISGSSLPPKPAIRRANTAPRRTDMRPTM